MISPQTTTRNSAPAASVSSRTTTLWLRGAPSPEGEGRVPDITAGENGLADWSGADIVFYLESGMDPDFDVVGGSMVAVQENLARLPEADRAAIAAYLKEPR